MIFNENCLLADNSHEITYLIFFENLSQNFLSAAVAIGDLKVNKYGAIISYATFKKTFYRSNTKIQLSW